MIRTLLLALGIICSGCLAAGAPASEASIREMLAVTEVRKLLDNVLPQYDALMKNAMNEALGGKLLDETGKKIADKMSAKLFKLSVRLTFQNHLDATSPFFNKMHPVE